MNLKSEQTQTERKFIWSQGKRPEIILARWSVFSYMAFVMLTIIIGGFLLNLDGIVVPLLAFFFIVYFISGKIVVYPDKIFIPTTLLSGRFISFEYIDKIIVEYIQRSENTRSLPSNIIILYNRHINYLNLNNFFMDQGCRDFITTLKEKTSNSSTNIIDIENVDSETVQKLKRWEEEHKMFSSMRLFISGFTIVIGFLVGILPATDNEFFNVLNVKVSGNTYLPPLIFLSLLVFSIIIWISREDFFVGIGVRNMLIMTDSEIEPDGD